MAGVSGTDVLPSGGGVDPPRRFRLLNTGLEPVVDPGTCVYTYTHEGKFRQAGGEACMVDVHAQCRADFIFTLEIWGMQARELRIQSVCYIVL